MAEHREDEEGAEEEAAGGRGGGEEAVEEGEKCRDEGENGRVIGAKRAETSKEKPSGLKDAHRAPLPHNSSSASASTDV